MRAVLLHQRDAVNANIRWVPPLPEAQEPYLIESLIFLRERGYFASPMPEGDGISIRHDSYDEQRATEEITEAFQWLDFFAAEDSMSTSETLRVLNAGRKVKVRYLVPIDKLLIYDIMVLGPYTIYPQVTPYEFTIDSHPWAMRLLDVPGADVDPDWTPRDAPESSLAHLLAFPLIEGELEVDSSLLFLIDSGFSEREILALQITEHADRVIDVLRFRYCNHDRPQMVPQHAGVTSDGFREAYIMPIASDIDPLLVVAKPQTFEAINVWLGLEANNGVDDNDIRLATIASGACSTENDRRIRSGLRSKGQSFLLVNAEIRFVSLVLAIDVVAAVGRKQAEAHRKHVAAVSSYRERQKFPDTLASISRLYKIRNRIVHEGASFYELNEDPVICLTEIDHILASCIEASLDATWQTALEVDDYVSRLIQEIESTP